CEDGNTIDGDGCSATCQLELCGNGTLDGSELCDDGNQDNTDACPDGNGDATAIGGTCVPAFCGDGHVWAGVETCDDGNVVPGDGCDASCQVE
ncbi:MAG: DUF4215 domain-containing protein, partial [bacterium]